MTKRATIKPHYSGPLSDAFWFRVNTSNDETLYLAACALADHETRLLQMLSKAVERKRKAKEPR